MAEVCYNQSEFDYRREEGANQSHLKKIIESPAHYQASLKYKLIPTPSMEMGTALHTLVLDGHEAFKAGYVKKPDGLSLATKEGKEWKASLGRKKVLVEGGKDDPWNSVIGMGDALRRLEWFSGADEDYIKYNEVSVYWDWEGVRCKARLDRVLVDEGIVLDLKTTDSVEPELFSKKVVGLGYDFQASFYAKAAEEAFGRPFRFIFVAIERRAPYTCDLFEASQDMLDEGHAKCVAALRLLKTCQATNEWPGKQPTIRTLDYPSWYVPYGAEATHSEELF